MEENLREVNDLNQQITESVAGLTYMSETDAELVAFAGQKADVPYKFADEPAPRDPLEDST